MNYGQPQQPRKEDIEYFTYLMQKHNQRLMLTPQEQNDYHYLKGIVMPYIEGMKQQQQQPVYPTHQANYSQPTSYPGQYSNNPSMYPTRGYGYNDRPAGEYVSQNVPYEMNHATPNMYVQPSNNMTTVSGSDRWSSNSNAMKDNAEQNQIMDQQRQQAFVSVEKQVEAKEPDPLPVKGSEYKPLILVTQKCMKSVNGGVFEYVIQNRSDEEKLLEYEKHAAIYKNSLVNGTEIKPTEVKDILFNDDKEAFDSINQAMNDILMLNGNNENESKFTCSEAVIYTTGPVQRVTNDPTIHMYGNLFKKAGDLKTLASELRNVIRNTKSDYTINTFKMFDERITKLINVNIAGVVSSKWTIGSFMDDIEELYDGIASEFSGDNSKANRFYNMLIDVFNYLKNNVEDIDMFEDSASEEDKLSLAFYTERVTFVCSTMDEISYELLDLRLTDKNTIKYIDDSITPYLSNGIKAVFDYKDYMNKMVILIDKNNSIYRIMKSKVVGGFSIERIK